jgi:hypothetical protein
LQRGDGLPGLSKGKQNTAKGVVGDGVSGPKSDSGLIVRKRLTGLAAQLKNRAKIVLRGEVARRRDARALRRWLAN